MVPKAALLQTPSRWYKTNAASAEDIEVSQGTICFATDVPPNPQMTVDLKLEYTIEFTGDTPLSLEPVPEQKEDHICDDSSDSDITEVLDSLGSIKVRKVGKLLRKASRSSDRKTEM